MTLTATVEIIDARGMACPGPLLGLIGAIRAGAVGDVIEVLSNDEGSKTDIWHAAKWAFDRAYWHTVPVGRMPRPEGAER